MYLTFNTPEYLFIKVSSLLQFILHIDIVSNNLILIVAFVFIVLLAVLFYTLFSERKSAQKLKSEIDATKIELVEKTEVQKALFQGSVDPIIIFNTKNLVVDYNKAAEDFFGYNFYKLVGKEFSANESFNNKVFEWMKQFNRGEGISGFNTFVHLNSGRMVPVSISISPIFNIQSELTYLFFWYRDISKDYEFQKALRDSEESYRNLFENVNDAILVLRKNDRRIIDANKRAFLMYGYRYLELVNSTLAILSLNVFDEYKLLDEITEGKISIGESIHKRKDGKKLFVEFNATVLNYKGEDVIIVVTRDISEHKAYEEQLHKTLKEKEILLREIHHRVKNNLQLITSLLDLQIGTTNDSEAIKVFIESQNRIRVMSIVYERLYESVDLHTIDTKRFVKDITDYLYGVYKGSEKNINIYYFIDDFDLDIERAVPVSLILCELVGNALKYAFQESSFSNTIEIKFTKDISDDDFTNSFHLEIRDNGGTFPTDLKPENSKKLGLQLVYILAKQLKGKLSYDFVGGTSFTLEYRGESER
jgi:PAS domain S-box-containing protein